MDSVDEFLDLACLTYEGNDAADRHEHAAALLASDPSIGHATISAAAATGDAPALAAALEDDPGAARDAGGPRDWQPLHYLCFSRVLAEGADPLRCVELLLASGADPAAPFMIGPCTLRPLTGAIGHGEGGPERQPPHAAGLALARRLLAAGAPPNDPQACYNRSQSPGDDWLELLIEYGLGPDDEIDWDMKVSPTPRMLDFLLVGAAKDGHAARLDILLRAGADPNAHSPYDGRHVLVGARVARRTEIAASLVSAGSAPRALAVGDRYRIALAELDRDAALAAIASQPTVVDDKGALADAAGHGFADAVALAIELGAGVDVIDRNGATPLHRAALGGHVETARVLLDSGADATLLDRYHSGTPLDWARHAGRRDAIALLEGL